MAQIEWVEDWDDNDNSFWEGLSPYTTDSDPEAVPDVKWRLRQRLENNQIEWYADHDAELSGVTDETWISLEGAKAVCQQYHDQIITAEAEVEEVDDADTSVYCMQTDRFRSYRPGEVAEVVGVEWRTPDGYPGRACFKLLYEDGDTDFVAISDSANYRLLSLTEVGELG